MVFENEARVGVIEAVTFYVIMAAIEFLGHVQFPTLVLSFRSRLEVVIYSVNGKCRMLIECDWLILCEKLARVRCNVTESTGNQ